MKRKTFARLRLVGLSLLLLEAVTLMLLLLAHNSAAAQDGGNFGGSGKGAGVTGASHDGANSYDGANSGNFQGGTDGGHNPFLCGGRDCPIGAGDTDGLGVGGGQDFTGPGAANGGFPGAGGNGGNGGKNASQDPDWAGPAFGFFGFGGGGGGSGGAGSTDTDGGKNSAGNGANDNSGASGDKDPDGQQGDGGENGGDGGGADPVLVSDFLSPDTGNSDAGDPPPGAGDPLIVDITDPITPVPEPMSGALLAAGIAGMLVIRKRRRR